MTDHRIVSREDWTAERAELLAREKQHTRAADDLARQRRELPWTPIEKEYRFDTDDGPRTLADLFGGRSQLLVYHFMFGPAYQAGCPTCSSMADGVVGTLTHLNARDVSFVFVSQAPLETLQAYKRRMGWGIPWVSAADSDFNFDLGHARSEEDTRAAFAPMIESGLPPVLEYMTRSTGTDIVGYLTQGPGFTAFIREDGSIYQTYSTTARGLEFLMGYYPILDRAPLGRGESGSPQKWVRRHDEYDS